MDRVWKLLKPNLKGRKGTRGGNAQNNRRFINAVFWNLRTGAPWRDLPAKYGDWKNNHRRFCRWRDKGEWEKLLEILIDEPEVNDRRVSCKEVHPHVAGAKGGNQDMGRTKWGSIPKFIERAWY
ncbi:MAG: transposase [Candidatus Paraimprobicoccus trichonymphae]|uniref:Transposase n=1 Tax=Candidatus Paraimprobicoccus trichonymphae TaxID=3033793 RepID=A0AA48I2T9_9FIRM|nr:MAG: transposase [Candidatus Paraimprobicoccus trichonymphae]